MVATRFLRWGRRARVLGLLVAVQEVFAQPAEVWRYFASSDGLVESYVGAVSAGKEARIWITHGQVANMDVFDGFSVGQLPSPGIDTRVEEGAAGELWAVDSAPDRSVTGLKVLAGAAWKTFPVADFGPPDPELLVTAIGAQRFLPFARGRVLYIAKDGLREFDSSSGKSRLIRISGCQVGELHSLARSRTSGFWLAGERALGRGLTWPSDDGYIQCRPWGGKAPGDRYHFGNVFDDGDEVFASAREGSGKRIAVRADAAKSQVLSRTGEGENGICAWSAGGGAAWVLRSGRGEQRLLLQSPGGEETPAPKNKLLSGRISDIAVQTGGVSWIAAFSGLARVAPHVWQPMGPSQVADHRFTSIAETPDKTLVFLGVNTLWILSGGRWMNRPLPLSAETNVGFSNRMAVLANGKVAIPVRTAGKPAPLLVYDGRRDRFETPAIAGYADCAFAAGRSHGRAWVACRAGQGSTTLFSFDGTSFERWFDLPSGTATEWPRTIVEAKDGSVWVGAFWRQSLYRYANGRLEAVGLPPEAAGMGVSDITELPDGRFWIGGRNLVLERNGSAWLVAKRNLDTVRRIYPTRDGSIWIAAGSGVTRCREDGCVLQGVEDGLPEGVVWTLFEDSSGRVLVGTTAGVRYRDAAADPDPPRAEVSSQLNVAGFAPGGEVRFVPTGTDRWRFTSADRLLYSYRVGSRPWSLFEPLAVISLKGVAAGSHLLEVRAMDRNFNISSAASFQFHVLVPWYRQPAWVLSVLFGTCILAFSIHQYVGRHHELQRAVESTTERLRNEFEEHSRTHARFEAILDHAPTPIYVKDLSGRYMLSNLRHCEVVGMSREEVIGKTDAEIYGPGSTAPFASGEAEALAQQRAIQLEETDSRSSKTYLSLKFPIFDSQGKPNAVCGISTDITESKQLRDRAQTSQRLEAVGLLAGGVAHDFNNLLTVINGYSELLLKKTEKHSRVHEGIAQIRSAGERAAGLTSQLLAFSRKQIVQQTVLNPGTLIADLEKLLRRLIGEDIELITRVTPDVGNVRADATQIQQVVMNLVLNARDAMPGGGRLSIEAQNIVLDDEYVKQRPDVQAGHYVMIAVSDTGTGMTPAVQARVFEPFFTTKEPGRGTGLGLASVYGMVKQSGGWIWVYSELGRGTTFKVYLPRTGEAATKKNIPAKADLNGNESILVVEDQAEVRALAVMALQRYGYTVYEAPSGAEALSFCGQFNGTIHLLLTDVVMPGMNGHELARQVVQLHPETKVLYMSGYTESTVSQHGVLCGENRYLQKPFTPELLAEKLRQVLGLENTA